MERLANGSEQFCWSGLKIQYCKGCNLKTIANFEKSGTFLVFWELKLLYYRRNSLKKFETGRAGLGKKYRYNKRQQIIYNSISWSLLYLVLGASLRIFNSHTLNCTSDTVNPSQVAPVVFISIYNTLVSSTGLSVAPKAWYIFGVQCTHSVIAALVDELSEGISCLMS